MEEFSNAVKAVCIVSAAVCIVENLVSGTRLRSQMRLILNLVLLMAVTAPFVRGGLEFELPDFGKYDSPDYSYSMEIYHEELKRKTSENVSAVLLEQITAAGIKCEKIEVGVNISEDSSISISRVIISADDFNGAAEIVRSSLGSETEVIDENT